MPAQPKRKQPVTGRQLLRIAADNAAIEALFASIGEGVIATDHHGKITRANQAAAEILGFGQDELIGAWFPKQVTATYENGAPIEMIDRPVTKAIVSGQTVSSRITYQRKDGSLVPVSLTVSPIMQDGQPVGAIEVFRDISPDIENDRLKTEFISVASHQLRTPLSAINIYARMLHDGMGGPLAGQQAQFVDSILTSVERMNSLINTLLNITRIEAGGITVNVSSTDLREVVDTIIHESTVSAHSKGLTLHEHLSKVPAVDTDPLLVKEVLANLMSNAIKYTPAGGTITVSLRCEDGNFLLSVKDTGFGIPLAARPHVFTKFFRANNVLSEDVSGTGLGLYLTRAIAESLGGDIWFDSHEGRGSTFYFSLSRQGSASRQGKFKLDR